MPDRRLNLHLVSDATGDTLNAIVRATTVQFEGAISRKKKLGAGDYALVIAATASGQNSSAERLQFTIVKS